MTSQANRALFETMIGALGQKEFDVFESCLADDILLEWPFPPMPGFPSEQRGARDFRLSLEAAWQDFDPYAYRIATLHDLANPNSLIAEYSSHSRFLPTGEPYSNRYISVFDFADEKITRWREYLNPQIVAAIVGEGVSWSDRRQHVE